MFTDNESQEIIIARLCPCDYNGEQYAKVRYTPKEPKIVNNNTLSTAYNNGYAKCIKEIHQNEPTKKYSREEIIDIIKKHFA